jgi:hypothetical protein
MGRGCSDLIQATLLAAQRAGKSSQDTWGAPPQASQLKDEKRRPRESSALFEPAQLTSVELEDPCSLCSWPALLDTTH